MPLVTIAERLHRPYRGSLATRNSRREAALLVTDKPRVLVVDDDPEIRNVMERIVVSFGYEAETAGDGVEAIALLALGFDLILLDGEMPIMDGFEVAQRIREDARYQHLPIVMITGLTRPADRMRAIEVGVNDFVNKPVDPAELKLRAKWLIEMKHAFDQVKDRERDLQARVEQRTLALRSALEDMTEARRLTHEAHLDTIRRLTLAAEYKDELTASHIERIGLFSEALSDALGLGPSYARNMRHAAMMHDVGKLGVPEEILLKPGKLTDEEWVVMRSHTVLGQRILANSPSPLLQLGERIAISHHEKWDGSGYPYGLAGEEIPIEGRICAVVDFFDALTMDRPYRPAVKTETVLTMMRELSGSHFDPDVLSAFIDSIDRILEIQAVNSGDDASAKGLT